MITDSVTRIKGFMGNEWNFTAVYDTLLLAEFKKDYNLCGFTLSKYLRKIILKYLAKKLFNAY